MTFCVYSVERFLPTHTEAEIPASGVVIRFMRKLLLGLAGGGKTGLGMSGNIVK